MKKFFRENALSVAMFSLFAVMLVGLVFAGYAYQNEQLEEHHQPSQTIFQFIGSGTFIESVFENWESEFLQMGALVLLTIWLVQKGAADSKELDDSDPVNAPPSYSLLHASTWNERAKAVKEVLYANSLTIALFGLFLFSFLLHALGGVQAANEEASLHGAEQLSVGSYVMSSQFWFESLQNWQSEFLAVGVLLVLSIFLRQRYSPESKPVESADSKTGA